MTSPSLQVYRRLLRSASRAFKDDGPMLAAAQKELRSKFEESRTATDAAEIGRLQAEGNEAAEFLSTYIVQAAVNDKGNFAMTIGQDQVGTFAEPVVPGMPLPRERRGKKES